MALQRQLIIGGRLVDLPNSGGFKAITSIPGWAVDYNAAQEAGGQAGSLATLVTQSVWAARCITLRANALAAIPWRLCKYIPGEDGEEKQEQDEFHPLNVLLREVNEDSNWGDLLRATEWDLCVQGAAFWLKILSKRGSEIVRLKRLNAASMTVKKESSGITGFEQTLKGQKYPFDVEEIIYFRDFHPLDDLGGMSMTAAARSAIETEINCNKYLAAFFENYAVPATYVTTEQQLNESDWQRANARWKRAVGGVTKAFKTLFLDQGLEPKTLGVTPKDQDLAAVRAELRRDICAAYGIPPAIAGAWEAANYAASTEQRMSLYQDTEIPRAEYIADKINAELVPYFDPSLKFEFLYDDLDVMQEDLEAKANRMKLLVDAGIITPNAAARDMGYSEEDFGSGPAPEPSPFGQFPQQFAPQAPQSYPMPEPEEMKTELRRWRRKALRMLKEDGKARAPFETRAIPETMKAAIEEQLAAASTADDVHAVFASATAVEPPAKAEEQDVNEKTMLEFAKIMAEAMSRPTQSPVVIQQPNVVQPMAMDLGVLADAIKSAMSMAREERPVTVNVAAPEVTVAPAEVHIENKIPAQKESKKAATVVVPKLRASRETQQVERDRKGQILGSVTDVQYEYEEGAE